MTRNRAPTNVPEPDPRERAFARTIGQPDLVARVLLARGIDDPDRARALIRPNLSELSDPFAFTHMERAVERVRRAVADGESIVIHGDYDVDGITGTVLLLKFFSLMQVDVKPHIPGRQEGYSFTSGSVEAIRRGGHTLAISVDNGTNAGDSIQQLQETGCDVIVTDHHGTSDNVADAYCVLNPRLPDAGYPDRELAGCGVAYRLATAIAHSFSRGKTLSSEFRDFVVDAMAYVALGTVADVAPLRGENRVMVHHGLRALEASPNPGIRALLDSAGITNRAPDAEDIAFRIAPLINAAGRVGHAHEAVKLLMAPGYQEAQEAARVLEKHNEHRRRIERELAHEVRELAASNNDKIIVLAGEGWHLGVLGIVAARLAETTRRPSILISLDGERGRGSGRSPKGIHLREALHACSSTLLAYGGHAAAAGLEIESSRIDEFRERINTIADDMLEPLPPIDTDGLIELHELDPRDLRKLDLLGPFGSGNRRPTFVSHDVKIVGYPSVDARSQDLRFRVAQNGQVFPARLRGGSDRFEELRDLRTPVSLVFSPRITTRGEDGPVALQVHELDTAD